MSTIDFSIGSEVEDGTRNYEYGETAVLELRKEDPSFEESERALTRSLAERIQQFEEGIYQIAVIDNAIRVKTLSKAIVAQKIRFWESRSISNCNHMIGGIAVFVLAVAYGILKESPLAGIGALVGIAYAVYEGFQMAQAKGEIEKWKRDPLKEIADQRLAAFKQGLIYIYKEDQMRNSYSQEFQKILSRNELQGLYRQYFHSLRDRLASAHDDKTKLLILSEVACYSPLASHIYRYALLPQEKVDQMEEVYTRYINFLRDYNSVDARMKREMKLVDESHKILIEMIEKEETLKKIEIQYDQVLPLFPDALILHQEAYQLYKHDSGNLYDVSKG